MATRSMSADLLNIVSASATHGEPISKSGADKVDNLERAALLHELEICVRRNLVGYIGSSDLTAPDIKKIVDEVVQLTIARFSYKGGATHQNMTSQAHPHILNSIDAIEAERQIGSGI